MAAAAGVDLLAVRLQLLELQRQRQRIADASVALHTSFRDLQADGCGAVKHSGGQWPMPGPGDADPLAAYEREAAALAEQVAQLGAMIAREAGRDAAPHAADQDHAAAAAAAAQLQVAAQQEEARCDAAVLPRPEDAASSCPRPPSACSDWEWPDEGAWMRQAIDTSAWVQQPDNDTQPLPGDWGPSDSEGSDCEAGEPAQPDAGCGPPLERQQPEQQQQQPGTGNELAVHLEGQGRPPSLTAHQHPVPFGPVSPREREWDIEGPAAAVAAAPPGGQPPAAAAAPAAAGAPRAIAPRPQGQRPQATTQALGSWGSWGDEEWHEAVGGTARPGASSSRRDEGGTGWGNPGAGCSSSRRHEVSSSRGDPGAGSSSSSSHEGSSSRGDPGAGCSSSSGRMRSNSSGDPGAGCSRGACVPDDQSWGWGHPSSSDSRHDDDWGWGWDYPSAGSGSNCKHKDDWGVGWGDPGAGCSGSSSSAQAAAAAANHQQDCYRQQQQQRQCGICFDAFDPDTMLSAWRLVCDLGPPLSSTAAAAAMVVRTDSGWEAPCYHLFCLSCMQEYVRCEVQARKHTIGCPEPGCSACLAEGDVTHLLMHHPRELQVYEGLLAEQLIDPARRVYCPYKDCSLLMQRPQEGEEGAMQLDAQGNQPAPYMCPACQRDFCLECNVAGWHVRMTCKQFQALPLDQRSAEDAALFSVASTRKWRRCPEPSCGHMVERTEGCNHMVCVCGGTFCYSCGARYLSTQPTAANHHGQPGCTCALFDVPDDDDDEEEEEEEDEEEGQRGWQLERQNAQWGPRRAAHRLPAAAPPPPPVVLQPARLPPRLVRNGRFVSRTRCRHADSIYDCPKGPRRCWFWHDEDEEVHADNNVKND